MSRVYFFIKITKIYFHPANVILNSEKQDKIPYIHTQSVLGAWNVSFIVSSYVKEIIYWCYDINVSLVLIYLWLQYIYLCFILTH